VALETCAIDLATIPSGPGAYVFLDRRERPLYIGRASDLRQRVRSYWHASFDRPGLRGMVRRVRRVLTVVAASEHEGALIERALIERYDPPFNRIYGTESVVGIRMTDEGLQTVHEFGATPGARLFGPYLGWSPTLAASRAIARAFPIHLARQGLTSVERDLARKRGITERDRDSLRDGIVAALERDAAVLATVIREAETARDQASALSMYERAAEHHAEIAGLQWIAQPQSVASFTEAGGWLVRDVLGEKLRTLLL